MRYHVSLYMVLSTSLCMYADEPVAIDLCPDIIAIIDGLSFGIHGELVGAVYKIARDVQAMQLGKRTPQGRVGIYNFEEKPHTIKSLVVIENELNEALQRCQGAERAVLEKRQNALKTLLKTMKQDFSKAVTPFLAQARGAKEPMFLLISESCTKRNRPKSLLLDWAHSTEEEMVAFDRSVTSFALFDGFSTDLINFLGDLVHSCPKARAQFEKLKEDYMRKQAAK
jgi:hypothetical protein